MKRKVWLLLSVVLLSLSLAAGVSAQETNDNIVDVLATDGRFTTAYNAVIAAGLADTLASADNSFTVFVPRDRDFNALETSNPGALDFLMDDPEGALTSLINYHVVPGKLTSADLLETETLTTIQGGTLAVTVEDGVPFVNGARIVEADIPAKNGVIHVINDVLLPSAITFPEQVDPSEFGTIIEVLTEAGNFTHLLDALEATDLTESFSQPGNYTLFAPTDAAFESFNSDNLTVNELKSLLLFHVVGDQLTRDQLATDDLVPTLSNARPIFVNREDWTIQNLSGADVLTYNIPASNGIIHAVNDVMIP